MTDAYLMCGLPGAGKTTRAKQIEADAPALRFSADEWLIALHGPTRDTDALRDDMEALQFQMAMRVVELGTNVILDWGLWRIDERDYYRWHLERLGARTHIVFCDAPVDELKRRIAARNAEPNELHVGLDEVESWVHLFQPPTEDELDGWNLERAWYHHSDADIVSIPAGTVITQAPARYRVIDRITPADVHPHTTSQLRVGQEWVVERDVAVDKVQG
jgi:predicted kinase